MTDAEMIKLLETKDGFEAVMLAKADHAAYRIERLTKILKLSEKDEMHLKSIYPENFIAITSSVAKSLSKMKLDYMSIVQHHTSYAAD
jgi:predicted aldo/keto reductase-like oxidoreductase